MPRSRHPLRTAALTLLGVLAVQVGAFVAAPGVNARVLGAYFRALRARGGPLVLYDWLAGGGLSRGAWLALGVMPYLSAWAFVRLARVAVPAVRDAAARDDGHTTLRRWTRALTLVLALVQSFGFATFVQRIPGAVARPGTGFVIQMMLVLTAGALAVMWLGERITGDADEPGDADDDVAIEPARLGRADEPTALGVPAADVAPAVAHAPAELHRVPRGR
jgi:preprotein translocase subunit SecY